MRHGFRVPMFPAAAASSNNLWGNFAHRAEICTSIVQHESLDFRAVMHPECSFWNKTIVPAKKAAAVATALLGSPISFLPSSLPEWYVLQHEQVHFAIMELAARQLSEDAARLAAAVPGDPSAAIARLYGKALARAQSLHSRFDRETSGKFDADTLESWVNVLERQLASLCDEASPCPVRNEAE